jgi:hypothetical protein
LATTEAAPLGVKVQVLAFCPALEHAPDQIASRPLETERVTAVPEANEAVPVLPTATLIPTGVEVILSPERPVAVTLRVTDAAGTEGLRVRMAARVTPPPLTEMVTIFCELTDCVVMLNPPRVLPAGIRTELGVRAIAGLLLTTWKI